MNYSKLFTGLFLGMFVFTNAQNNTSQKKLIATAKLPNAITKKIDANTVLYSYPANASLINDKTKTTLVLAEEKIEVFTYPTMRLQQGAILPFEIVYDGDLKAEEGIKAQDNYYKNLALKPELNKIVYQDIETTKERLNAAGIYDANDLESFGMPLIAKIVGAGILVTARIEVETMKNDSSTASNRSPIKEFTTKVVFAIFNSNGKTVYRNIHAPYASTIKDSYQTTLNYLLKQTPFYFKK